MQITGDWEIGQMELYAKDIDYGITWMPVPKAGDAVVHLGRWLVGGDPAGRQECRRGVDGHASGSAAKTAAAIYTTAERATCRSRRRSYEEKDLFSERHQFFLQLLPTAKNRPPLPVGAKYWDELSAAWQKNYLNQGQPADLLKDVKDRVNGDLQRFCPSHRADQLLRQCRGQSGGQPDGKSIQLIRSQAGVGPVPAVH